MIQIFAALRGDYVSASFVVYRSVCLAVVAFLLLTPVVMIIWSAFIDNVFITFPPAAYTTKWFGAAIRYDSFVNGFIASIKVAAIASVLGVAIGILASLALVRSRFAGRQVVNTILLSPLSVPNIVLGTALYMFFISVSDGLGLGSATGTTTLICAHLLLTMPWCVRLISANLVGLDRSIEEAAANLGANPWTVFLRVTLPQMRAGVIAAALFSFIISFENLELSLLLVGPGETTLPIAIMQYLEFNMDPTIAAASTLQIAIIAGLLVITDRFVNLSRIV